jgi:glutamate--cysteine ligase catalytic subunit
MNLHLYRRQTISRLLLPNESVITLTSFPQLGSPGFLYPRAEPNGIYAKSLFVPDEVISAHARFS